MSINSSCSGYTLFLRLLPSHILLGTNGPSHSSNLFFNMILQKVSHFPNEPTSATKPQTRATLSHGSWHHCMSTGRTCVFCSCFRGVAKHLLCLLFPFLCVSTHPQLLPMPRLCTLAQRVTSMMITSARGSTPSKKETHLCFSVLLKGTRDHR